MENNNNSSKLFIRMLTVFLLLVILVLVFVYVQLHRPSAPTVPPASPTPLASFSPTITQPPPTNTPADSPTTQAQLPQPDAFRWQLVADGLTRPVDVQNAGDGSGRLFVVEQGGTVRIIQDGVMLEQPFLDIHQLVNRQGNEQGLLGLAFHPRYAENGYFFINYTDLNGQTVIARMRVSAGANLADPSTELRLLQVSQPYANHNGGGLAFGPDGYLYIGLGDGGKGGDPLGNGQNSSTLLGKLLRIDVDGAEPYAIPADNPYVQGGGAAEVWAMGLRNPWRFSFDPASGGLYIGDVGQEQWEEIDYLPANSSGGANFGWNYFEGFANYAGTPPTDVVFTPPVTAYSHSEGCSVTGGVVYRGSQLPAMQGIYLYGDYCSGSIWGLLQLPDGTWQNQKLFSLDAKITTFGVDEAGEVYLADLNGRVYTLTGN